MKKTILAALFGILLTSIFVDDVLIGQEYIIQAGDKLKITFWQQPNLNSDVTVSHEGTIELPVIGRIRAAGLSPRQLSDNIVEQMSRYRINITQASVTLTEYQRNKIYVNGQVAVPGAYSFEVIPNLWKIIQEAGGPIETADLKRVTVIRPKPRGNVIVVDLTKFFENGDLSQLPSVYGGDTIYVPAIPVVGGTGESGLPTPQASPFLSKNEIYLVGEVVRPGRYNFEEDLSLLDALIMAGGPTPTAKLSDVRVLKRLAVGNNSLMKIDLDKYLSESEPKPLRLHPGDTIYVPRKINALSFIFTTLVIPVVTGAGVFLVVDAVRR